jgi:hypothetical protein
MIVKLSPKKKAPIKPYDDDDVIVLSDWKIYGVPVLSFLSVLFHQISKIKFIEIDWISFNIMFDVMSCYFENNGVPLAGY